MPLDDTARTPFVALGRHAESSWSSPGRMVAVACMLLAPLLPAFCTSVGRSEQMPESSDAVRFRPVSAEGKDTNIEAPFRQPPNENAKRGTEPAVLHKIARLPMAPQEGLPLATPHGTIDDIFDHYKSERPQVEDDSFQGDPQGEISDAARWSPKPVTALGVDIGMPAGPLPREYSPPPDPTTALSWGASASARGWPQFSYCWCATGLCYNPLYFEEVNLERYGYGCCHCLQPAVSAAHFFVRVPALPYLMAVDCPWECNYTLGHYRPGNCNPWRCHYPPCTFKGGVSAAGAATALVFILP